MNSSKKIALFVVGIIGVGIAFWGTRISFRNTAKEKLQREAEMQVLRFESQLNGEIKLALQMAKSPVVIKFMENPEDEFYSVAGVNEVRLYQESFLGKSSFWASTYDDIFWSNCEPVYKINKEDPSQYWYKMTLYETDVYNFNINYNDDLKQTALWLNAVVRNKQRQPIGMCGTGIPLDSFIASLFANLKSNGSISMYTFNDHSEVTGSKDQSLVERKTHIDQVIPAMKGVSAYTPETRFLSTFSNEYILMPMTSIGWTLLLECPFNVKGFFSSAALPFGLLLLLIVIVAVVIFSGRLFNPLNALRDALSTMGTGNADLSHRIQLNTSGSLPIVVQIVDGFNSFIENIQETVKILKNSESHLEVSRLDLNSKTNETIDSIDKISRDIDNFTRSIKQQTSSVQQTASAVNQISANISSLDNMIATQTSATADASSAVEQMLGNIKSVNNSVEKLSNSFAALEANTSDGVAKHEKMNEKIIQIQKESAMLAEANEVISAIAEQTNLLAMNAAIEAAHAGEAGKGFSVVADEIRKLSENSSSQSKTISQELAEIQRSIEDVVTSSAEAGASFQGVSSKISDTDTLVREIAQAMREQETGSKQISDSLTMLNNASAEVRTASKEMSVGNKTILDGVQVLQDTTTDLDNGMDELNAKSEIMKNAQTSLSSLSKEMDEAISTMNESLAKFKI